MTRQYLQSTFPTEPFTAAFLAEAVRRFPSAAAFKPKEEAVKAEATSAAETTTY